MRSLASQALLELWERVAACPPPQRGQALVGAALPDLTAEELGGLSLGECETALLELHEAVFGGRLQGFAACPACGAALEAELSIPELRSSVDETVGPSGTFAHQGYEVRFRLLTLHDLAAAAGCTDVMAARGLLLERAVVGAWRGRRRLAPRRLPAGVVEQLGERLAACDPWAESRLALDCPACGHQWSVVLDVAEFLWTALRRSAQRLVLDVHTLAAAYGWREADILAMSQPRRAAYLELVVA